MWDLWFFASQVNGEFQLPILSAAVWRFSFLRFLKEIIANELWAIIDVSEDYFQHIDIVNKIPGKCRRRPSGVIIRARDDKSEVSTVLGFSMSYLFI